MELKLSDVERLFGGADFAKAVFAARPGQWVGPIRSGFGWHLIRVTDATPGHLRAYADARGEALQAWQEQDRNARNDIAYRALLARYAVRLPEAGLGARP